VDSGVVEVVSEVEEEVGDHFIRFLGEGDQAS